MTEVRWRKALRDLWLHRGRSALVVLALAVGLAGAGSILATWALVQRATELGFRASAPVSATLTVQGRLDAAALARAQAVPGVAAVRARRSVAAQVQVAGGAWRAALLHAIDDYRRDGIARLQPLTGDWPPPDGALVIERSSLEFSGAAVGDAVQLRLRDGSRAGPQPLPLRVAGTVRDVALAPGWMEHLVYGYVSAATLAQLGAAGGFDELQFRVADPRARRDDVAGIAQQVEAALAAAGLPVVQADLPEPGEHIHAAQIDSLLMTQGAFGLLALLACALLVVHLVQAMLAGQAREIAVLKVLGASARQIGAIYLAQAALLGLLASLLALPVALLVGRRYGALKGELLNLPVDAYAIPAWAIVLMLVVGIGLPLLAAALPVRRACRASVGEGLRDIGLTGSDGALEWRRGWVPAGWSRPLLLSLANALRRRGRLATTVAALAVAGAVGIGADNLRAAVRGSVDALFAVQRYELSLRFAAPQPAARLEAVAAAVPGVAHSEGWRGARALLPGRQAVTVLALPAASTMLRPAMLQGRWPAADDEPALVISRRLAQQEPSLQVGSEVTLTIDGTARRWRVAGMADGGPQAVAYTGRATLHAALSPAGAAGSEGPLATTLVVRAAPGTPALPLVQALRDAYARAGIEIASSQLQDESRRVVEDHLLMVVQFLGAMGWLMLAIGGIGLASALGLAVLERRREIGVLRALGARGRDVLAIVQTEALAMVALAWLVALPLSAAASVALGHAFGRVMFSVPVQGWPQGGSALLWLAAMIVVALLAGALPARRALQTPAAQSLRYD